MKKNFIILLFAAIFLIIVGVSYHHDRLFTAQSNLTAAKADLMNDEGNLTEDQLTFDNDKAQILSDFTGEFPDTKFKQKDKVILPANENYHYNTNEVTNWFVYYLGILRMLNGQEPINCPISSSEQDFANRMLTNTDETKESGNYGWSLMPFDTLDDFCRKNNIESDQQLGYELVMMFYDRSGDAMTGKVWFSDPDIAAGYIYRDRALLLYTGPLFGLAISDDGISFAADPITDEASFQNLWNAKSSPKDNVPLPDLAFYYVSKSRLNIASRDKEKIHNDKISIIINHGKVNNAEDNLAAAKKNIL